MPEIRVDQWLAELERLAQSTDDDTFRTTGELQATWKVSIATVRRLLRLAKERGLLRTQKVSREDIAGVTHTRPGYKIIVRGKRK